MFNNKGRTQDDGFNAAKVENMRTTLIRIASNRQVKEDNKIKCLLLAQKCKTIIEKNEAFLKVKREIRELPSFPSYRGAKMAMGFQREDLRKERDNLWAEVQQKARSLTSLIK
jgi:hypothetical protein